MSKVKVEYIYDSSVAKIVLDDSKGNVIDHIMVEELFLLFKSFSSNKDLKLITIEGAGKHFSFGASVEEHKKEFADAMLTGFHRLFYTLRDLSIPLLAKVSGQCLGGGFEIALMCNQIFCDETAKFGQPEIVLGVFPPPASVILPEKIGLSKAEDLLITGRSISAGEAKIFGIVNEVFSNKEDLNLKTNEWIEKHILPKSSSSLRFAVKASRIKFNHVLTNFLGQLEQIYLSQLMLTHDANEGINAFVEKRSPNWKNN